MNTCNNCVWAIKNNQNDEHFSCHLNPPTPFLVPGQNAAGQSMASLAAFRPLVNVDPACCHFEAKINMPVN